MCSFYLVCVFESITLLKYLCHWKLLLVANICSLLKLEVYKISTVLLVHVPVLLACPVSPVNFVVHLNILILWTFSLNSFWPYSLDFIWLQVWEGKDMPFMQGPGPTSRYKIIRRWIYQSSFPVILATGWCSWQEEGSVNIWCGLLCRRTQLTKFKLNLIDS